MTSNEKNNTNWLAQLVAFVLASIIAQVLLSVGWRYFLKWCQKKGYSPGKGALILFVWMYLFGIAAYVLAYLMYLFGVK